LLLDSDSVFFVIAVESITPQRLSLEDFKIARARTLKCI
jgi:hypothetical protein